MADSHISSATDLSRSMVSLATRSLPSPGTRQATSGFRVLRVLHAFKTAGSSKPFPGPRSDASNKPRSWSRTKAACGCHSGKTAACRISRTGRSARLTRPRKGLARAMSRVCGSIGMARCGPQPKQGGLSRIKDGRVSTLTIGNGLPCNTIHWSIEDDHRSLWMYTACGLVRVHARRAGCVDRRPDPQGWHEALGCGGWRRRSELFRPPTSIRPWQKPPMESSGFVSGEGIQVIDPDHLPFNTDSTARLHRKRHR